jgi:hypothetical protein
MSGHLCGADREYDCSNLVMPEEREDVRRRMPSQGIYQDDRFFTPELRFAGDVPLSLRSWADSNN